MGHALRTGSCNAGTGMGGITAARSKDDSAGDIDMVEFALFRGDTDIERVEFARSRAIELSRECSEDIEAFAVNGRICDSRTNARFHSFPTSLAPAGMALASRWSAWER